MHIRQKTLVLILSRARRKTVLKMAAAAANLANLSPRQRFATKTLFFLRAYPRSPKSPLAVRVFAFCTPMDCGGRTDVGRKGRAGVIGQGRDELTFAEFGGGRDGRTPERQRRARRGGEQGKRRGSGQLCSMVRLLGKQLLRPFCKTRPDTSS